MRLNWYPIEHINTHALRDCTRLLFFVVQRDCCNRFVPEVISGEFIKGNSGNNSFVLDCPWDRREEKFSRVTHFTSYNSPKE